MMLFVFALGIAPKQLLHNAITGHKHSYAKFETYTNFQASKNSFHCSWHNDVFHSPFLGEPCLRLSQPATHYASHADQYISCYYFTDIFYFSLRGPPRPA
jgi:hypothetical protein